MAKSNAVIIGGGVVGVCCAYYLAREGWDVTLLEQGDVCSGCSYGNCGMIVPSHSIPLAAPGVWLKGLKWMVDPESPLYIKPQPKYDLLAWLWRFRAACNAAHVRRAMPVLRDLSYASRGLFQELAGIGGFDFGYRENGMLTVFRTAKGYEEGIEEAHLLREGGISVHILGAADARTLEPTLAPGVVGGVLFPDDASLVPDVFVRGLAGISQRMGVQVRTETEVLGFRFAGDKIAVIETTRGDFEPGQVVLAGGSWSAGLAAMLGLRLPIQAGKGYSVTYHRPPVSPQIPMIMAEARVGVTPMGQSLRLGGTLELAGLDFSINRRRVDAVVRSVLSYVRLENLRVLEIWRGLRPLTPDGLPVVGRPGRFENLIVATGHAMLGISLGPITGRLVAQLARREEPMVDLTALAPDRFV
jgi:D-amino-acid dehydrogenase